MKCVRDLHDKIIVRFPNTSDTLREKSGAYNGSISLCVSLPTKSIDINAFS